MEQKMDELIEAGIQQQKGEELDKIQVIIEDFVKWCREHVHPYSMESDKSVISRYIEQLSKTF